MEIYRCLVCEHATNVMSATVVIVHCDLCGHRMVPDRSAERTYTTRELREAERAAATRAAHWGTARSFSRDAATAQAIEKFVDGQYPLPERPRVPRIVKDPHDSSLEWSVRTSSIVWRRFPGYVTWISELDGVEITAQRVALWAYLLANPEAR